MDNNRPIIVPWDFSELAEFALQHAEKAAQLLNCDIVLLHIVKKSSEIAAAEEKMQKAVEDFEKESGLRLKFTVKEGSIFTDINRLIEEENALFAVMGTHGIKGMQKFTGSWALKVIIGSESPFIVVQDSPKKSKFENIVFPVDYKFSEKEKLVWADFLFKYFGAKIHLCYIEYADPLFRKKVNSNLITAKKFLSEKNINFETVKTDGKSLYDETLNYAEKIDADLIMITTTKNISLHDYMLGASEQKMIANEKKIPVMTINPSKKLTKLKGFN